MRAVPSLSPIVAAVVSAWIACSPEPAPVEPNGAPRPAARAIREDAPATPRALYDDQGFRVPDAAFRREAVGALEELPAAQRRAFAETEAHRPVAAPEPGDWLAEHPEPGQTFDRFRRSAPNLPEASRRTIYIKPLGPVERAPLASLEGFTEDYFGLPVVVLPPAPIDALGVEERVHDGHRQLYAPELLTYLKGQLPEDAYCLVGLTTVDLYPDPDWNYVFGYASLSERVGVHSFARYDPAFHGHDASAEARRLLVLRRGMKVMAHELGHMFGMEHCVFYDCVMNGSNHLEEADRQPLHLCPVCLRKLHSSVGFDPGARYRALARRYHALEQPRASTWARRRADDIERARE